MRSTSDSSDIAKDYGQLDAYEGKIFETIHRRKDGSTFSVEISSRYMDIDNRKFYQNIIRDVIDRKIILQKLQESKEQFRSIYENSNIGLYRTAPDGRILLANPALINMLGYSSFEELAQRNLEEEGYETGYERSYFKEQIARDGIVRGVESSWKKKDGTPIFIRESAKAISN